MRSLHPPPKNRRIVNEQVPSYEILNYEVASRHNSEALMTER